MFEQTAFLPQARQAKYGFWWIGRMAVKNRLSAAGVERVDCVRRPPLSPERWDCQANLTLVFFLSLISWERFWDLRGTPSSVCRRRPEPRSLCWAKDP